MNDDDDFDYDGDAILGTRPSCGKRGPRTGWTCELAVGHTGDHYATETVEGYSRVWSDTWSDE